ncbi:hypothetical protein [Pseudonocardia spinosispora]|uniref:hypothetical protein n=1 Tax=Pseudonocardia spinosispora TaxID=103441 RepID=UPI0006883A6B|nr:hypothetical protein [Pseudonocardia spinosispora]
MVEQNTPETDPLIGLAVGRIVLGVAALLGPNRLVRAFGMSSSPSLSYLTRIYGARAVALGIGYLTEPPSGRRRWHRIGLAVDTSDTLTAVGHLVRRDAPQRGIAALAALTGGYMLVGAVRLVRSSS